MSGTIIRRSVFGVCILFTAILLLYLIAAANNGTIKYVTNNDIQLKIYRYYGAAGCIDLMDKNNIPVDEEYRKNAKNDAAAFISYTDLQKVGSSDISKLICIDSVFGLDLKDELFTELHRRYNKDARLFDENLFDNYSEVDDDTKLALQLTSTDEIWRALDSFGLTDEEYNIKQILADGFNNNLDKYDHNDIYNGKISVSSELENIFYTLILNHFAHKRRGFSRNRGCGGNRGIFQQSDKSIAQRSDRTAKSLRKNNHFCRLEKRQPQSPASFRLPDRNRIDSASKRLAYECRSIQRKSGNGQPEEIRGKIIRERQFQLAERAQNHENHDDCQRHVLKKFDKAGRDNSQRRYRADSH